jgi:hypothetical protein
LRVFLRISGPSAYPHASCHLAAQSAAIPVFWALSAGIRGLVEQFGRSRTQIPREKESLARHYKYKPYGRCAPPLTSSNLPDIQPLSFCAYNNIESLGFCPETTPALCTLFFPTFSPSGFPPVAHPELPITSPRLTFPQLHRQTAFRNHSPACH